MYELALVWAGVLIGALAMAGIQAWSRRNEPSEVLPSDPAKAELDDWTRELDQRLGLREQADVAAVELARTEQAIAEKRGMVPSMRPRD